MTRNVRSVDALILLSSAVAVILLAPLRSISEALPLLAFIATFLLFMTPGILLTIWFFRDRISGPAVAPVAFAISTGLFGLLGVPFLVLHQSIEFYLWTSGTILAVSLATAGWKVLRSTTPAPKPGGEPEAEKEEVPYGPPAGWLWTPFVLLAGGLAFVATRRVPNNYDDIWVYLSWVRDFASAERLALHDPYFGERTAELSRVKVNGWLL